MRYRLQQLLPLSSALIVALAHPIAGQDGATQPPAAQTPESEPPLQPKDLPWPIRLGLRVGKVNDIFPVVDRVVLVPDAETYIDELTKWSAAGRWPVLFDDERLAPMFVRRFRPKQVIRRESVGAAAPADDAARRQQLESIVIRTWGGDPKTESLRETFAGIRFPPQGVVIASTSDPAWTAAVALAAGRGQPLAWLDEKFGVPDSTMPYAKVDQLRQRIRSILDELGYSYAALGDEIETITLCRAVAGGAQHPVPGSTEIEPAALTDILGRNSNNERFAFVGWIFGDEARSAYVAMCSLFLSRTQFMLHNVYDNTEGWRAYSVRSPAAALAGAGYGAKHFDGKDASLPAWMRMLPGGLSTDVLVMNSGGNADYFNLFNRRPAHPDDVPVLNTPVALHLTHSWSMRRPADLGTVGGQWLAHGVYAYVGSMKEPYLSAFLPPRELANRWMRYVPFLVGARHWAAPAPYGGPWKVNTFGDPLMLCPPPRTARPRVEREVLEGRELRARVRELVSRTGDDKTGAIYAEAIGILDMLGTDEVATELWRRAEAGAVAAPSARAVLGPAFRLRRTSLFLRAWGHVEQPDHIDLDMLWHLLTPTLGAGETPEMLRTLEAAVRRPFSQYDAARLAPRLRRTFGADDARRFIEREIERATIPRVKQKLSELLNQY